MFQSTAINVTTEGHKHLGAVIGSEEYEKDYVDGKVTEWVGEIVKLAEIATTEPQACYSAYVFGLKHKWTYFLRTIPDTQDLLEPLERAVSQILIPTITGHKINQLERDVLSLPVRCGGLGFGNPQAEAAQELNSSVETTAPLVDQIMSQQHQLPDDSVVNLAKQTSRHKREEDVKEKVRSIYERAPDNLKRTLDLSSEKGSSVWLTVVPLHEFGFNLNKREFRDAIKLRYDWPIEDIPTRCVCGDIFSVDHSVVCKKGGFIIQRHNELRDLETDLLSMVCKDVEIESQLQDVTGEQLSSGSNLAKEARLTRYSCPWLLGKTSICIFRYSCLSSQCRVIQTDGTKADLPFTRERKEALLLETCSRH